MRKTTRIAAGLLASMLAASSLAGCSQGTKTTDTPTAGTTTAAVGKAESAETTEEKNEEPVQMEWLVGQTSAEVDDDAELVKMIEERFNIDLKTWYVDSNKFTENLNVRFAGGEMPDVLVCDVTMIPDYVEGGIIGELPLNLIREKAPSWAKAAEECGDPSIWSTLVYKGKNYGVPNPMDVTPMAMIWRKDWLDKLGLEVPTTLEEYEKVLTAFVEQDPDGNGIKDTAGMAERVFGAVFGAFGMRCVTGADPKFKVAEMQLGEDNVPFFPYIRPEAKEALTVLNDWYSKGIIDKEFITGENHGGYQWTSHSFLNGKIGLTSAQPLQYLVASNDTSDKTNYGGRLEELKALNPEADIVFGPAPVGPEGKSGTEGWNKVGRFTCLTTKGLSDPRKVEAFLAMLEAYYSDMEYAKLVNYGIEGKHYNQGPHGPVRNVEGMDGTKLRKEGVMQVDFGGTTVYAQAVTPEKTKFGHDSAPIGYYRFNAPPCQEFSDVISTLDTLTVQAYFDMITGNKPIDYFDTFVEEFKKAGGETAEKAVQEAYRVQLEAVSSNK